MLSNGLLFFRDVCVLLKERAPLPFCSGASCLVMFHLGSEMIAFSLGQKLDLYISDFISSSLKGGLTDL